MLINNQLYPGIHQEFYIWFWEEGEENPGEKVGWNGGRTKSKIFIIFITIIELLHIKLL